MIKHLKFSHKNPAGRRSGRDGGLAAFAGFNAYLQRQAIDQSLRASLTETGRVTAGNVAYWLDARIKLIDSPGSSPGPRSQRRRPDGLLEQKLYTDNFDLTYLGEVDGTYTKRPHGPVAGRLRCRASGRGMRRRPRPVA